MSCKLRGMNQDWHYFRENSKCQDVEPYPDWAKHFARLFLRAIRSMSLSLTSIYSEYLLIILISYLAVLNPKTPRTLQNLSKSSSKQWIDFFAFVRVVLSCFWNCRLPLQYQHSDCDVDIKLLDDVQVYFLLLCPYEKITISFEPLFAELESPKHHWKMIPSRED